MQQGQERFPGRRKGQVSQGLGCLGNNFRVAVCQQGQQRPSPVLIAPGQLPNAPNGMDAGQLVGRISDYLLQGPETPAAPVSQLELGFLPDALVGVAQQGGQAVEVELRVVELHQPPGFFPFGRQVVRFFCHVEFPDPAGILGAPPVDPIGQVQGPVGPEADAGGQYPAQYIDLRFELEPGPFRLQVEGPDMRTGRVPDEFHQEELILPGFAQGGARVVLHARGAVVVVLDGGHNVGGLPFPAGQVELLFHPDFVFVVGRVGILAELPVGAPARIGAVYQVHQAFAFAGMVAVVV